jgi:hypothetical protein
MAKSARGLTRGRLLYFPTKVPKERPAATKTQLAKHRNAVVKLPPSPKKEDQRLQGGTRTLSTGLCGGLQRQAGKAVLWEREIRDIQAQTDDLPRGTSKQTHGPRCKNSIFGKLVEAEANAATWLANVRKHEYDIEEATVSSDKKRRFDRADSDGDIRPMWNEYVARCFG